MKTPKISAVSTAPSLPKLTTTGLADYMASSESKRRKILRNHKYPEEDESRAKILYYREARDLILEYHRGRKDPEWLENEAELLRITAAATASASRRTRLENNARSLSSYASNYDSGSIALSGQFRQNTFIGGVRISIAPDIFGLLRKKRTLIKLDFGKKPHPASHTRIIWQLFQMAAADHSQPIAATNCIVRHIESKTDWKSTGKGTRIATDIQAACENIAAIWNSM